MDVNYQTGWRHKPADCCICIYVFQYGCATSISPAVCLKLLLMLQERELVWNQFSMWPLSLSSTTFDAPASSTYCILHQRYISIYRLKNDSEHTQCWSCVYSGAMRRITAKWAHTVKHSMSPVCAWLALCMWSTSSSSSSLVSVQPEEKQTALIKTPDTASGGRIQNTLIYSAVLIETVWIAHAL